MERSNRMVDLNSEDTKVGDDFEEKLAKNTTIKILTKKKLVTEQPLIGKSGYIVTANDEIIAVLVSSIGEVPCCGKQRSENDPLNYILFSPGQEEIMSIYGLNYLSNTEDRVEITYGQLRMRQLGSVTYNYLGADGETLSKVTELAGREESYLVPTSVLNSDEELLYIFRRGPEDDLDNSEILLADGSAWPVAELLINYKGLGAKIKSVSVNFKGDNSGKEKTLILGVAITLFNQWLARREKNGCCFPCVST